jgi:hypothetical protein
MNASSPHSKAGFLFLLSALAAIVIATLPARADLVNIAPDGTAIMGYNTGADLSTLGTSYTSDGTPNGVINNPSDFSNGESAVDTYRSEGEYSFAGIQWSSPVAENVYSLNLYLETYNNGGWFGQANYGGWNPVLTSSNLSPNNLEVEVQTVSGGSWSEVASTNNYVPQMTGFNDSGQGDVAPEVTFTLTTPLDDIYGIRIIGLGGDPTGSGSDNGWIGVHQLEVEAPEVSTYAMLLGGFAVLGFLLRRKSVEA